MSIKDTEKEMSCVIKAKTDLTHTCCSLLSSEKEQLEKKNCCSGTSKMSCCITVIAIQPTKQIFKFIVDTTRANVFRYKESKSSHSSSFFHPPILV